FTQQHCEKKGGPPALVRTPRMRQLVSRNRIHFALAERLNEGSGEEDTPARQRKRVRNLSTGRKRNVELDLAPSSPGSERFDTFPQFAVSYEPNSGVGATA